MASQDQVFNEYFLDLLKKLKTKSKEKKDDNHEARVILRSIKKFYQNNDRLSSDFRKYMNETEEVAAAWGEYETLPADDAELMRWVDSNSDVCVLFREVPLHCVKAMMSDTYIMHHYFTIINIFRVDMSDDDIKNVINVLKNLASNEDSVKELISNVDNETIRVQLGRIMSLFSKRSASVPGPNDPMAGIENTSLGKLAKEIMEEVNVDELQTSLGNGDIMSALANPDGGLVKLLGTVSQKMISKMSTGEIKQENLLQDAMKLASQLGGSSGLGPLGDIASMFGTGSSDDKNGFDMSSIAKMMSGMGMGGGSKRHSKVRPNTANLKRMSKARDLRTKLDKKRSKENVSVHVEEEQ